MVQSTLKTVCCSSFCCGVAACTSCSISDPKTPSISSNRNPTSGVISSLPCSPKLCSNDKLYTTQEKTTHSNFFVCNCREVCDEGAFQSIWTATCRMLRAAGSQAGSMLALTCSALRPCASVQCVLTISSLILSSWYRDNPPGSTVTTCYTSMLLI